ncbi:MAG: hypothetical protein DHS20C05_21460 [Hyphococcus sp.]|nr:MAG: hypothetical protein DHS20C05_21460 [Marinicaulis sp.]
MLQRVMMIAAGAVLLMVSGASAGDQKPLTEDQAKRFAATLPALETLKKEMDAEGKTEQMAIETQPKAGEEFKPYSKAVAVLKKDHSAEHARLAKAVKPHGFTPTQWGSVGDRVMVAYMAIKMQEQDPKSMAMMEGMDKSMLDMVPPEMRAQLESTFAMMETVKNAPEADKKAVAAVKEDLDKYMDSQDQS